ncbi:TetR/AcrR family transcriptional regulator [Mumia sp. DW29H23]|uniref:TetR/AcrR family transcriptional regulator n=1 Tax=Mumia sp. DW29H23 TaxID=3421241 RepID=UPI003D68C9AF
MPRINAPTVAEHRERQRRAILDGARALLAETGEAPSLAAVGERAGLARSSVYQYFGSREDLLAAVVADVFPDWASQIRVQMDAATTPGGRVWAYVRANVAFFAGSENAVAHALTVVVDPQVLRGPMEAFHDELQAPLIAALTDMGEPRVPEMAALIDSMVIQASRSLDHGGPPGHTSLPTTGAVQPESEALALLRRVLGGYLGLEDA